MGQKTERTIKEEHFANLVAVAYSDEYLNSDEKEFLFERAEEYGLDKEIIQSIILKANELQFSVPLNNEDKEDQLTDIVYMAMIDGHVHEKEFKLCLSIAQKLGYDQKDLEYIIDLTKKLWEHKK